MPSSSERRVRMILVALLALGMSACERVVQVTAPTAATRLVVEARLERAIGRTTGDQRIRLSTTENAFSTGSAPAVRGATVQVRDSAGLLTSFTESVTEPGVYVATRMALVVGVPYTLRVTWNGETYTATERMLPGVPIDSLYFDEGSAFPGAPTGLRATINFRDPAAQRNWYLWDQWIDGVRVVSNDSGSFSRLAIPDELLNGSRVEALAPFSGITVRPGQLVRVRQITIPENIYRFYTVLSSQTSNNGSPFGVPATNLRGNIANATAGGAPALGYFFASEYSERQARVVRTGTLGSVRRVPSLRQP